MYTITLYVILLYKLICHTHFKETDDRLLYQDALYNMCQFSVNNSEEVSKLNVSILLLGSFLLYPNIYLL